VGGDAEVADTARAEDATSRFNGSGDGVEAEKTCRDVAVEAIGAADATTGDGAGEGARRPRFTPSVRPARATTPTMAVT
jgi:hypothetical protein